MLISIFKVCVNLEEGSQVAQYASDKVIEDGK